MAGKLTIADAVQGARLVTETLTWPDNLDLSGATITGTKRAQGSSVVTSIDGTLTPDADQATYPGRFTWAKGPGDVGTAGTFEVQLRATNSQFDATISSRWTVHALQSASAVAGESVVGVPQADADFLAAAEASAAGATDGQVLTADGAGGAAFEDAAGGAADVSDLTTAGLTPGDYLRVDNPSGVTAVNASVVAAAVNGDINIMNANAVGAGASNYFRAASVGDDAIQARTPAQVLSDIGGASSSDLTSHTSNTSNPHSVTAAQADALPEDAQILSKTMAYEVAAGDEGKIIECSGTFSVTLPNGLDTGFQVTIVNVGSGTITLAASTTLQGEGTQLATQYTGAVVYHRGSNVWLAMGKLT